MAKLVPEAEGGLPLTGKTFIDPAHERTRAEDFHALAKAVDDASSRLARLSFRRRHAEDDAVAREIGELQALMCSLMQALRAVQACIDPGA
jgi:hypothetical protein